MNLNQNIKHCLAKLAKSSVIKERTWINQRKTYAKGIFVKKVCILFIFSLRSSICILISGTFQVLRKESMLIINAIALTLYNPTKIAQSNRHLTTTQSCLQYPNQEWLLQYPMLETHGSWLVM